MNKNPMDAHEQMLKKAAGRSARKIKRFAKNHPGGTVSTVLSFPVSVSPEEHFQQRSTMVLCCGDIGNITEGFIAGLHFILTESTFVKDLLELFHDRYDLDMQDKETLQYMFFAFCLLNLEYRLKENIDFQKLQNAVEELRRKDIFSPYSDSDENESGN